MKFEMKTFLTHSLSLSKIIVLLAEVEWCELHFQIIPLQAV